MSSDPGLDALIGRSAAAAWSALGERGDGLPVAAVDRALIDQMVGRVGHHPDHVLVAVPPLRQPLTVADLAVCAVLAGCDVEVFPVAVAAVTALTDPDLNAYGFTTTTGSAAPLVLVNGPIADRAGFNSGGNCLGPGCRANATVGRTLSFVLRIVGGARAGFADMATLGQPAKYTCCLAENEAASPWLPFHVERGFAPGQSTATITAISGIVETFEATTGRVDDMIDAVAVVLAGSAPTMDITDEPLIGGGQPMVVMTPEWAVQFDRQGYDKGSLRSALFERAVRERPGGGRLRVARRADDILIVVAGGVGVKQAVIPNWNGGSRAVTVPVEG